MVRDVVAEVAPEELPLVAGLARFDDDTVVRRLNRSKRRREPLGFGTDEVAVLVTSMVWLAVDEAARKAAGSAMDGAATRLKALLRKVFRRRTAPITIPPLTREQLGEVRHRVLEMATQQGLSDRRATVIADAVVVRLALAGPDGEGRTGGDHHGPADSDPGPV